MRTAVKRTERQRSESAATIAQSLIDWQCQIEREAEAFAKRVGASPDEITAYREGCRHGATAMTNMLRLKGLIV